MRTELAIDPNVRVRGNATYAGFEDILHGEIVQVGDWVTVREVESGLVGEGRVTEIDLSARLIYLSVDWSSLTFASRPREVTPSMLACRMYEDNVLTGAAWPQPGDHLSPLNKGVFLDYV